MSHTKPCVLPKPLDSFPSQDWPYLNGLVPSCTLRVYIGEHNYKQQFLEIISIHHKLLFFHTLLRASFLFFLKVMLIPLSPLSFSSSHFCMVYSHALSFSPQCFMLLCVLPLFSIYPSTLSPSLFLSSRKSRITSSFANKKREMWYWSNVLPP